MHKKASGRSIEVLSKMWLRDIDGALLRVSLEQKTAQPWKVIAAKKTVKAKKVKKAKQTVKAITVKNAKGMVTYEKTGGSAKLTVTKAGKIVVKKKTKKGTYSVKVMIRAAGNGNYLAASKTVAVKIKVK